MHPPQIRMTNDEIRRNDEFRMTKLATAQPRANRNSGFGFISTFDIQRLMQTRFMVAMRDKGTGRRSALEFLAVLAAMCVAAPLTAAAAESGAVYNNPVLAGDYPDPSIIRVGKDFWATATSSEWGPQFPVLHSRDLVNWKIIGAVFLKRPAWAVGNFWAPEISEDHGRYCVYYVGRKKDGPLSVAVA